VGGRDLFRGPDNYEYFLGLYDKYMSPVAETYAWCLMPNHFHILIRIKEENEIGYYKKLNTDRSNDSVRFQTTTDLSEFGEPGRVGINKLKRPIPSKHFSHLFNAYSKYINTRYETRGALFERPFKRKLIDDENYLKQVILYIHNNPVHHGFCSHPLEYPWTSYLTCSSQKKTKLKRDEVIGWFGDETKFKQKHDEKLMTDEMNNWLELE
jgi:REP element-mobilizing transposase RayT